MLPDLESLRCFDAAATHLSFRVAARTVALSPAAFGERIKRLEDHVGASLFERTTRRVTLTPAGERLVPQARRALDEARRCIESVRENAARAPFDLVVGTRFELGLSWLTPALGPLRKVCPERSLHLFFSYGPDLISRVQRGLIDCTVTSSRLAATDIEYELLHEEQYVFVGAKSLIRRQPLARREHASTHVLIDAAAELPLFRYFLDAKRDHGAWSFARIEYLGTIGALRLRVLEGAGVAVLPRYFIEDDLKRGKLERLLPSVTLPTDHFRLVWRRGHPRERELRALASDLRAMPLR